MKMPKAGYKIQSARPPSSGERGRSDISRVFVAIWLFSLVIHFALQFGAFPDVLNGLTLVGSDDAMRLMSIRDLVGGQGWYDKVQYRVIPPDGMSLHWSRPLDAIMAAFVYALEPLVGQARAEIWLSVIWPGLLFALYLAAVAAFCIGAFSYTAASIGVLTAAVLPMVNAAYFPFGRLDHHGIQVLLLAGAVALLARASGRLVNGVVIGSFAATSLSIGLEMTVPMFLIGVIVTADFICGKRDGDTRLLGFAVGILVAAPVLFLLDTPQVVWTAIECDRFSFPYLSGCLLAAASLVGAVFLRGRFSTPLQRLMLVGAMAALSALVAYPYLQACSGGPFTGVSADLKSEVLDVVLENRSAKDMLRASTDLAVAVIVPHLVLTIAVLLLLIFGPADQRRALAILAVFLLLGLVGVAYQYRALAWGGAFQPVAAGVVIAALVRRCKWLGAPVSVLFFVFVMSPGVLLRPFMPSEIGTETEQQSFADRECQSPEVLAVLNDLPAGLVMNPLNLGAFILVHTKHDVLSAPYHRSEDAMLNGMRPFLGDGSEALELAEKSQPDYLVLCNSRRSGDEMSFRNQIIGGEVPDWLESENIGNEVILVFRTRL